MRIAKPSSPTGAHSGHPKSIGKSIGKSNGNQARDIKHRDIKHREVMVSCSIGAGGEFGSWRANFEEKGK